MKRIFSPKLGLVSFILLIFLTACNTGEAEMDEIKQESTDEYPNAELLADVEWLNEHVEDKNLFIIDARSEGAAEGHIPGAISLSSEQLNDQELAVSGHILNEADFTDLFQSIGLNNDSKVLVYDDGNSLSATRVFYALEYYGFEDKVKVLNGGYPAWLTSGFDIATGEGEQKVQGDFVAKENEKLAASLTNVEDNLDSEDTVFLDTRSADEYSGEDLRDNKEGGHIPGAVHKEWTESLVENDDGLLYFLPYEELKENFNDIGVDEDKKVVPYCQTNVRGAHSYFSLRLLGFDDIQPYEGSWSEWGNASSTEIEK